MALSLNNASSWVASVLRLGRGLRARREGASREPDVDLELYEFESCPFCRKVREVLSELDLSYVSRTCARGSSTRAIVVERGGKAQFPYLVDPNTGQELYESEDIISYVLESYGEGRHLLGRLASPLNTFGAALASAARPRGGRVRDGVTRASQPEHLLVLYNFEASPYCRKAREALCELDLDYRVHNVAKRSPRRPELIERGGKMQVPFLIDPNERRADHPNVPGTGLPTDVGDNDAPVALYESDDIVSYLVATYG